MANMVYEELEKRLRKLEDDIASRQNLDQVTKDRDYFYHQLIQYAAVGIARTSNGGHFLFCNQAMARMLGYSSPEELKTAVSNTSEIYVNPLERQRHLGILNSKETLEGHDIHVRRADGQAIWLRTYIRRNTDDSGNPVYDWFAIDTTGGRFVENSDYEYEKRFRMLVEQAGDSFMLHDQTGRLLDVNQHACESLGYSREEMLTMNIGDIAVILLKRQFWHPLTSGKYVTFENMHRRKDGSTFPVEVRLSRLDIGSEVFLLSLVRDITFRKAAEDELKASFQQIKELKNRLEEENVYLREEIDIRYRHKEIVGESKAIKKALNRLEKVAREDTCVLVWGETGTGKELMARAIHNMSPRRGRSMVKVNCAALPATLIENELFGREKGAFTGALTKQVGRFEAANQSTIFLDEIGDMPIEIQSKLLRVLQDGTFERLGSPQSISVDVRVVAATHQNLPGLIQDKRFRSDLYYRLNVFPIYVPSLRERLDDIPLLVWSFVKEFSETMGKSIRHIPKRDMDLMQSYTWPGNIRELRNVIERAMIMSHKEVLRIDWLEDWLDKEVPSESAPLTLAEMERRHIVKVLEMTGARVSGKRGAAEVLGLKESTLRSRMKKLGVTRLAK